MTSPVYIVKRFLQDVLVRTYGPFNERGEDDDWWEDRTACGIANRAAAKHPRCRVEVQPVHPASVRR